MEEKLPAHDEQTRRVNGHTVFRRSPDKELNRIDDFVIGLSHLAISFLSDLVLVVNN